MRANRSFLFLTAGITVLLAIAFTLSSVVARDSLGSKPSHHPPAADSSSQANQVHVLHGGFWRTDGGFVSTIRVKNVLVVAPIQVTPTLFMADGTPYPLPIVNVPISGVATVNINDALASAPQSVAPHISEFGSLMLVYNYPTPGHLVATLAAIDAPRSLSFVYMINEPMPMPEDNTLKVLEGLWWKHDRAVHGIISLSNTTDQERTATLRVTREVGDSDERQVELAPNTTQVLALEQFSREASDLDNRAGGVRVEYKGPSGAVMVTGSLANESEGYSANMPFWSHDATNSPAKTFDLGSAGIMVGKPDPVMMPGFPAETTFIPYLALRNATAKPMDVTLRLNYARGMDAAPINRNLLTQHLRPFEAKLVELQAPLHAAGLKSFDGMINLGASFAGHGGDLILANGSVDQTGTYVFEVRPQVIGESIGTISGYWSVAGGNDSMFSLWNPTDAPQDIVATLYYGDGSGRYHFPVHLAPQASITIDVAMLIREQQPDADGRIIPSSVREGSTSFDTAGRDDNAADGKKKVTTVIAGGLFNTANATCGMLCTYCNGYNNFLFVPAPINVLVGAGTSVVTHATDSYGNNQALSGGSWTTTNSAVMTVSNGNVAGVSAGQVTIQNFLSNIIVFQGNFCVSDNMNDSCPQANPVPSGGGTTQVPTSLKFLDVKVLPNGPSPPSGCPGSANYGILIDIHYQVMDQSNPAQPIKDSTMIPHEKGTFFTGGTYDNNIGPVAGYPTSGKTTASDGSFHDVPLGKCSPLPIDTPLTATQNITIITTDGTSHPVRSQTWTVSAPGSTSFGHGTIKNNITSPSTGSDVSASR